MLFFVFFLFVSLISDVLSIKFLSLAKPKLSNELLLSEVIIDQKTFQIHKISDLSLLGYFVSANFNGSLISLITFVKDLKSFSVDVISKRGFVVGNNFLVNDVLHDIFRDKDMLFAIGVNHKTQNMALLRINLAYRNTTSIFDFGWKHIVRGSTYDMVDHKFYIAYIQHNEAYVCGVTTSYPHSIATFGPLSSQCHLVYSLMITNSGKLILSTIFNCEINKMQLVLLDLQKNSTIVLVTYKEFDTFQANALSKNNNIVYSIFKQEQDYYYVITDILAKTYIQFQIENEFIPQTLWELQN